MSALASHERVAVDDVRAPNRPPWGASRGANGSTRRLDAATGWTPSPDSASLTDQPFERCEARSLIPPIHCHDPEALPVLRLPVSCRTMSRGLGSIELQHKLHEARAARMHLLADFVTNDRTP